MENQNNQIAQTEGVAISNPGVVARTAGILKSESLGLSAEEERAAAEQAIAEDGEMRSGRYYVSPPQ
jgi:hypothetical protein